MLTKVNDVIFQCLWRHSCQFKPQIFFYFLDIYFAPHFEKRSPTYAPLVGPGSK